MPAGADPKPLLVLVDDDPVFLRLLAENLHGAGYATSTHTDPLQGLAALQQRDAAPAACLFDWDMPGLDGLALLRRLREAGVGHPVLFLTGHGSPMFEEAALAAGAVDFIDKSRGPAIILGRIALALSRNRPAARVAVGEVHAIGRLGMRRDSKRVLWRGLEVPLSRGEFEVVELLALNAGADIGYRALYDALRGDGFMAGQGEEGYRANVRAMIKRIRRKFTTIDPDFDALGTYPGVGYRWRADG